MSEVIDIKDIVRKRLHEVEDPEMPSISIMDLGMITGVETNEAGVVVKMIPTFSACPAIALIKENIKVAVEQLEEVDHCEVVIDKEVTWNSNMVTEEGKRKIGEFGLGKPCMHDGDVDMDKLSKATCPHCGSDNTKLDSLFGSTLCRSIHHCLNCDLKFERFKPVA